MNDQPIKILGVNVSNLSLREVLESVEKSLKCNKATKQQSNKADGKPLVIFTPNPEIVVYAQKDEKFKEIVNTAQISIPDGMGLVWASQILGQPLKEKIGGTDLMEKLVELAAKKGLVVGLIGGGEGVAVKALECLRSKYPKLNGVILDSPEFRVENETISCHFDPDSTSGEKSRPQPHASLDPSPAESAGLGMTNKYFKTLAQEIKDKKIDILFVGLGCPKQEYFINAIMQQCNNATMQKDSIGALSPCSFGAIVLMAVGGSFDYLSGRVKRAPLFIRSIGLEWVFRLLLQPWRWKRQLAILKFVWLVVKQKLEMV